jgi:putative signal transducing protein
LSAQPSTVSVGNSALAKDIELVRVFATHEMARYFFAKSLLDRDEIEYVDKGEALNNVMGWAPSGWLDTVSEPAELWVRSEDAKRARSLLQALDEVTADPEDGSNSDA